MVLPAERCNPYMSFGTPRAHGDAGRHVCKHLQSMRLDTRLGQEPTTVAPPPEDFA